MTTRGASFSSAAPANDVGMALEVGCIEVLGGVGTLSAFRYEPRAGAGEYRFIHVQVGARQVEVCVSPTGRSVRVFVDGREVKETAE